MVNHRPVMKSLLQKELTDKFTNASRASNQTDTNQNKTFSSSNSNIKNIRSVMRYVE